RAEARVAGGTRGRLPRTLRSPPQVDGDSEPGARSDRYRADAPEIAQPPACPMGLRHRREAAQGPLAADLVAITQGHEPPRRGPHRAGRLAQRARQDPSLVEG